MRVMPFLVALFALVVLLLLVPQVALWLPSNAFAR